MCDIYMLSYFLITAISPGKNRSVLYWIILILAVGNSLKLHIFELSQFRPDLIVPSTSALGGLVRRVRRFLQPWRLLNHWAIKVPERPSRLRLAGSLHYSPLLKSEPLARATFNQGGGASTHRRTRVTAATSVTDRAGIEIPGRSLQSPKPKPLRHKGTWTTQSLTFGWFLQPAWGRGPANFAETASQGHSCHFENPFQCGTSRQVGRGHPIGYVFISWVIIAFWSRKWQPCDHHSFLPSSSRITSRLLRRREGVAWPLVASHCDQKVNAVSDSQMWCDQDVQC